MAGDPNFANVVLLCHCDGTAGSTTFTDVTGKHSLTATAVVNTTTVKFGTGSADFSAGGFTKISCPASSDFDFQSNPFTVEAWVYATSAPNIEPIANASGWFLRPGFGPLQFAYKDASGSFAAVTSSTSIPTGAWHHVAADRDSGGTLRVYLDGVVVASGSAPTFQANTTTDLWIGNDPSVDPWKGYIDDLRITKGVARYAGAFSVPTAAFPDSAPNTTWSTTRLLNVTLTGSNLIATASSATAGIFGADVQKTGKFYYELTMTTWGNSTTAGLANGIAGLGVGVTWTSVVAVSRLNGNILVDNAASGSTLGARANGDVFGIAVDLTNKLIWIRVGAAGNWNGSGTANPATATGGVSFTVIAPSYQTSFYPWATFGTSSDKITANFGDSAYVGTPPSGFGNWTTGVSPTIALAVTQTGNETWVTQSTSPIFVTQTGNEAWVTQSTSPISITQVGVEAWVDINSPMVYLTGASSSATTSSPGAVTGVKTYVLSGSRGGIGSVILHDKLGGRSFMIADVGVETDESGSIDALLSLIGAQANTASSAPTVLIVSSSTVTLTGAQANSAAGTLGITITDITVVTGAGVTGDVGSLTPTLSIPLVGAGASALANNFILAIDRLFPLIGAQIVTHAGTLTAAIGKSILLHGAEATTDGGAIFTIPGVPHTEGALTGSSLTTAGGHLTSVVTARVSPSGASATANASPLVQVVSFTLTGASASTQATKPTVRLTSTGFTMTDLEIVVELEPNNDTVVSLAWSDDSGATFGHPIERSLGLTGEYWVAATWKRLGMGRSRVLTFEWSAPTLTALTGAFVETENSQS